MLPSPRAYDPLQMTRYLTVRQQQILRWMRKSRVSPMPQLARER
jgi:membrane peptidoglycan carboxypeptidase